MPPREPSLPVARVVDWATLHVHLVWAYDGPPGAPSGAHRNPGLTAWLLGRGSVRVRPLGGGRWTDAAAGQWVMTPFGGDERRFSDDARILSVHFQARWTDGRELFEPARPVVVAAAAHPGLARAGRAMLPAVRRLAPDHPTRLAYAPADLATYMRLEQGVRAFVAAYAAAMTAAGERPHVQAAMDARVLRAREQIDRGDPAARVDPARLSAAVGLSPSQLDRLFAAQFGQTARAYAEQRRLDRAAADLRDTADPVKAVAFRCGFRQLSHFANWFKKHTGHSPRAYRNERVTSNE